jgi:predicted membrane protein
MGGNKIKLRKKIISPDNIDQHRNFSGVMRRHDKYLRMRGLLRFLIYFTIAVIFMVIILFAMWKVREDQHRQMMEQKNKSTSLIEMRKMEVNSCPEILLRD